MLKLMCEDKLCSNMNSDMVAMWQWARKVASELHHGDGPAAWCGSWRRPPAPSPPAPAYPCTSLLAENQRLRLTQEDEFLVSLTIAKNSEIGESLKFCELGSQLRTRFVRGVR
jgi:hypothetical protein